MPLVRIDIRAGKPSAHKRALGEAVYRAMREAFNVPENDRFIVINEHADDTFDHTGSYLGIDYTDDLTLIQITANAGRALEQKKALYARIAELLAVDPGLRKEDVFISIVEVAKENWSFGNGIAQYA
jgi:phenylpyruvate tautomerase PptA (4-oxalocrotonate tautomerase family)